MKLSNLKLLKMPLPEFTATQLGIGALRGTGQTAANIFLIGMESAGKSFMNDGHLKPFHEGAKHLASRIGAFAKERPAYMAAGALGSVGGVKTWNVLAKPFYPKPNPKLLLGQQLEKGIKRDINKISNFVFKHPLATIAGLAGAAVIANHMGSNKKEPKA